MAIALLPSTPETRGLLDAAAFAALPAGAHVVNLGRGDLIVEADLVAALDRGHLGHATLDVFRDEPLPPSHPFWHHPSVTVTPHIAVRIGTRTCVYHAFVTTAPPALDAPATVTLYAATASDVAGMAADPDALDTARASAPARLVLVEATELGWQRRRCREARRGCRQPDHARRRHDRPCGGRAAGGSRCGAKPGPYYGTGARYALRPMP